MKRIVICLSVLFIAILLWGCGGGGGNTTTSPPPVESKGDVAGNVYITGTTTPLSGVVVSIGNVTYTTTTDGYYFLQGISTGQQTITAVKSGYESYSTTINVSTEPNTRNIYMTTNTQTTSVTGKATNSLLTAVSGATVTIGGASTTTDATGNYQLPTIPQGNQTVTITHSLYQTYSASIYLSSANYAYNAQLSAKEIDPPTNIVATSSLNQINLSWTTRTESTVKGYNIYRSTSQTGTYSKLNSSLITSSPYSDTSVSLGQTYFYKISSVNIDNPEGSLSSPVSIPTSRIMKSFGFPSTEYNCTGLAFDGTYLWASDSWNTIYKMNTSGGSVSTLTLNRGDYEWSSSGYHMDLQGFEWQSNILWIGARSSNDVGNISGSLYKVNALDGTILTTYGYGGTYSYKWWELAMGIAYGGGYLWVVNDVSSLFKINPANMSVLDQIELVNVLPNVRAGPVGLAYGSGYLWFSDTVLKKITKIRTSDYTPVADFDFSANGLSWDGNYLWACDGKTVYQLNTSGL